VEWLHFGLGLTATELSLVTVAMVGGCGTFLTWYYSLWLLLQAPCCGHDGT